MTKKAEQSAELVAATLKKPHRHKGIEYPVGAEIKDLTKPQAERLTRREVI